MVETVGTAIPAASHSPTCPTSFEHPQPQNSGALLAVAWITTVLVSAVPDIAALTLLHSRPAWLVPAKMAGLVVLAVISHFGARLRPLRSLFILLFGIFCFSEARTSIDFNSPGFQAALGGSRFDARMQAEQTGKLAVSAAMVGLLILLGFKRREFFLAIGNVRAQIKPVPLLGFPRPDSWPSFGLQWGFYIAAALAVFGYIALRPSAAVAHTIVPMLPSIVFYAALNAFNEEITYRAPMLASLETSLGSRQALAISAFSFGIAHYFGAPGGIVGALASTFMGWMLGKAMVETRGLFWAWWIHLLSDITIFVFLAATLVK